MTAYKAYRVLCALLVLTIQQGFAQANRSYSFKNYSNREGFDQNTVWAIEQDKYGMLWLGTASGLIKYDGYSFKDVSWSPEHQEDIIDERIWDIMTDEEGLLWILSRNGLNIYDHSRDRLSKITSDSVRHFNGLKEDNSGSVWVFGNGYLASVSKESAKDTLIIHWTPNLFPEELADLRINDLLSVKDGLYLLATSRGIYKMSIPGGDAEADFEKDPILSESRISRFLRINDIVWIGTAKGLYKTLLDGNKIRQLNSFIHEGSDPSSIGGSDIRDLLLGPDNRLWIGTWGGGLSMYNNDDETFTNYFFDPRKQNGISSPMINCIYKDPFNVLWIGTAQGGLSKLDLERKQFTNIEHNPYDERTIPGNLINSILEDREGFLWVSTYKNPLCKSTEPSKRAKY